MNGTPPMFIDILANPDLNKFDLSTVKKGKAKNTDAIKPINSSEIEADQ